MRGKSWVTHNIPFIYSIQEHHIHNGIRDMKKKTKHNQGKNRFTKGHLPWEIIYTEVHLDWAQARVREKYLKSAAGKIWLKKQLN